MTKFIIGNWKMYKTDAEMRAFVQEFSQISQGSAPRAETWLGLAVPFTLIDAARASCSEHQLPIHIGAQNMHDATAGAFTGEIAMEMLRDRGAEFVILGHSERRSLFGESDDFINKKVKKALLCEFKTVLCVGESLQEHLAGNTSKILESQLDGCLQGVEAFQPGSLSIAYEPRWAIGTGQKADSEHIQSAHLVCFEWLQKRFPKQSVPLLYGGSVSERNICEICALLNVNGVLVGGASLIAREFFALTAN